MQREGGEREERTALLQATVFAAAMRREVRAQMSLHLWRKHPVVGIGEPPGQMDVGEPTSLTTPCVGFVDMAMEPERAAPTGLGGDGPMPSPVGDTVGSNARPQGTSSLYS